MDKGKSENEASVAEILALLSWSSGEYFFTYYILVHYLYLKYHQYILKE